MKLHQPAIRASADHNPIAIDQPIVYNEREDPISLDIAP